MGLRRVEERGMKIAFYMEDGVEQIVLTPQTKEQIVSLTTDDLWAILRSTNPLTERFANELTWAKAELRRRGHAVI